MQLSRGDLLLVWSALHTVALRATRYSPVSAASQPWLSALFDGDDVGLEPLAIGDGL